MEETKVVLHESVNKLLSRQGDLDELVEKSKDLSLYSKQFYKNAKRWIRVAASSFDFLN